jgi:hypothetical protein
MQIHVRGPQPGDLCVLLEPAEVDLPALRQSQFYLQAVFGGHPTPEIHLTCQRFESSDPQTSSAVVEHLQRFCATLKPIPIIGVSLMQWKPRYSLVHMLRWQIRLTDELRNFCAQLEETLKAAGAKPLYIPGRFPTLVTALEEIPNSPMDPNRLADSDFPHQLFLGQRIVLSKIIATDVYETLHTFFIG